MVLDKKQYFRKTDPHTFEFVLLLRERIITNFSIVLKQYFIPMYVLHTVIKFTRVCQFYSFKHLRSFGRDNAFPSNAKNYKSNVCSASIVLQSHRHHI